MVENYILNKTTYTEHDRTLREENQDYVDIILYNYPVFEKGTLKDGNNYALLSNYIRILRSEDRVILSPYLYIALSKYGVTQFNISRDVPLYAETLPEVISALIELSKGEEVKDLQIPDWRWLSSIRKTRGLRQLKVEDRTFCVTGRSTSNGVKDFYENILRYSPLDLYSRFSSTP